MDSDEIRRQISANEQCAEQCEQRSMQIALERGRESDDGRRASLKRSADAASAEAQEYRREAQRLREML